MAEWLFWLYPTNAVLLINHEIDSAYWREWNLFRTLFSGGASDEPEKPEGSGFLGINGFILFHFPLLFVVLYGLAEVVRQGTTGLYFSLALSTAGPIACAVHGHFIRKGRTEFKTPMSIFLLVAMLVVSLAQAAVTVYVLHAAP